MNKRTMIVVAMAMMMRIVAVSGVMIVVGAVPGGRVVGADLGGGGQCQRAVDQETE